MSSSQETDWRGYAVHNVDKPTSFDLIDFKPKTPGDYDIDIAINCCGICASDVHTITGGWGRDIILPMITGHEIAGKVVRVGSKVTEFKVGDRAGVGAQVCSCFKCEPCETDNENYCVTGGVDTYNAKYENGDIAHGGYSTATRVHERFVFPIPEGLADEDAAPMMCGGLTVYGPLKNYGVGKGTKLGVLGIGGLGHFAVMFGAALGAEVTAISHSDSKKDDALKMGAKAFLNTTNEGFEEKYSGYFDMILTTVDASKGLPMEKLFPMLKLHGRLHTVGLPNIDDPPSITFQSMAGNAAQLSCSHIGNKKQAIEMLELAAKNGIKTWKEVLPMKDAGKGVQNLLDNKVRYRTVLIQDINKSA
ncbi:alcohol dehydrogenase [Microbotryomycetes sp. JL201]|nr:alcohol dehydrogenase [Microbotryomycetes sp. JL201]